NGPLPEHDEAGSRDGSPPVEGISSFHYSSIVVQGIQYPTEALLCRSVHLLVLSEKCDVLGVFFFLTVAGQQVLDRGVECGGDQGQLFSRRARDVLVLDLPHVALAGSDPFGQRLQGQSSLQSELANALSQGCWHQCPPAFPPG